MATERRTVVITVDDRASRQLGKIEKQARRTATATERLQAGFTKLNRVVSVFAGGAILTRLAGSLVSTIDQLRELQGRVRLVTDETENFGDVWNGLLEVAKSTGTSIESIAVAYSRLGRAAQKSGIDSKQLQDVVEGLSLTFRISGSTVQETINSLIQLSQGLNAGALRGDEFRSVSEANITLLQLLEEQFKDTGKAAKTLAEEGVFTREAIFTTVLNNLEKLREEAKGLPLTLTRAFQKLRTVWLGILLDAENSTGVLQAVAEAFEDIAWALEKVNKGYKVYRSYTRTEGVNLFNTLQAKQLQVAEDIAEITERIAKEQDKVFGSELKIQTWTKTLEGLQKTYDDLGEKINKIREANERAAGLGRTPPPLTPPPRTPPPDDKAAKQLERLRGQATSLADPTAAITKQIIAFGEAMEKDARYADIYAEAIFRLNIQLDEFYEKQEKAKKQGPTLYQEALSAVDENQATVRKIIEINKALETETDPTKRAVLIDYLFKLQDGLTALPEKAEEAETALGSLAVAFGNVLTQAVTSASDAIFDFAFKGENSFKELANSVAESVAKMVLQFALLRAVTGGTNAFFPQVGAALGFSETAKGGVFDGGVQRMARGGIVNQPTIFPMASGMGLMGEAGPEAVIPLSRDASGRLGIKGGGTTVNVINNTSAPVETETVQGPSGEELVNVIIGRINADIVTGGRTNQTISQAFGLRRQGVPR